MKLLVVLFGAVALALAETSITTFDTPYKGFAYSSAAETPYIYPYAAPYATPYAAPYATPYAAPYAYPYSYRVVPGTQYHAQDILGRATYGHSDPFQTETAVQDAAGNKVGSYSYISPEGKVISTQYVADAAGFRVASNALPVGPSVPVVPEVIPPSPVVDTPEVVAARTAHLAEVEAIKSRTRREVKETPASTTAITDPTIIPYTGVLPYAGGLPYAGVLPYAGGLPYSGVLPYSYAPGIAPTVLPSAISPTYLNYPLGFKV